MTSCLPLHYPPCLFICERRADFNHYFYVITGFSVYLVQCYSVISVLISSNLPACVVPRCTHYELTRGTGGSCHSVPQDPATCWQQLLKNIKSGPACEPSVADTDKPVGNTFLPRTLRRISDIDWWSPDQDTACWHSQLKPLTQLQEVIIWFMLAGLYSQDIVLLKVSQIFL